MHLPPSSLGPLSSLTPCECQSHCSSFCSSEKVNLLWPWGLCVGHSRPKPFAGCFVSSFELREGSNLIPQRSLCAHLTKVILPFPQVTQLCFTVSLILVAPECRAPERGHDNKGRGNVKGMMLVALVRPWGLKAAQGGSLCGRVWNKEWSGCDQAQPASPSEKLERPGCTWTLGGATRCHCWGSSDDATWWLGGDTGEHP